jgi:hypothetical protein
MTDLPDYTRYISQAPKDQIEVTLEYGDLTVQPMLIRPALLNGTVVKDKIALVTDYLKQCCIKPPYVTVAGPAGTMNSYEGGYIIRALIYKAGAGEVALAKNCLDEWVKLQKTDGSWSQSYYPALNAAGSHDEMQDLQVDSGTALLAWAMAKYDASVGAGSVVYKTPVQKAMGFLRDLQYQAAVAGIPPFLVNMRKGGVYDTVALLGDCGECLMAMKACLDQYGADLTTAAGYSVKTMANDLYEAIGIYGYSNDVGRYWYTGYPVGSQPLVAFTYKEKMTMTQALVSQAMYEWYHSAYNTKPDYTGYCEKCLDLTLCLNHGKWGGFLYSPYYGLEDETKDEFVTYTALMVIAMNAVNATKYADYITAGKDFLKWMHIGGGRVFDFVRPHGECEVGKVLEAGIAAKEEFGWLALNPAQAILAGA